MSNKVKKYIYGILPRRAFWQVLGLVALHMSAYYVPKLLFPGRECATLATAVDGWIPFVPLFSLFYVMAFVQWVFFYLLLAREEETVMRRYFTAALISKLACIVLFCALPTTIARPEPQGRDLFSFICRVVYHFDTPTNLFPSMHCLESWLCMRLALEEHRRGRVPEFARSVTRGYSGEMIRCVNRRQWKELEEYLVEITGRGDGSLRSRFLHRRKWRFEDRLAATADDMAEVAEEAGQIYVRYHTVGTCLLSLLVVLSTVFIKQHYFVDILAAIALAELSLHAGSLITRRRSR